MDNLIEMRDLMYHMDSTIEDMKSNASLTSMDIDDLSKRILKLIKKLGVPSLGQLRKLETSKNVEKDIDRINDRVKPDTEIFESVKASAIRDIREGDVEQRLKEEEQTKLSSNASIQDIISNSIEAYRKQEEMEYDPEPTGAEEPDNFEEELSSSIMSLETGDIAEIAKLLAEGVEYETTERTT